MVPPSSPRSPGRAAAAARLLAPLLAGLLLAPAARATDEYAPWISNIMPTDCNGAWRDVPNTDTLTPTLRVWVADNYNTFGSTLGRSGLKVGRAPNVGSAVGRSATAYCPVLEDTVLLLHFDDADGTVAVDSSGYSSNGTLSGSGGTCGADNPCRFDVTSTLGGAFNKALRFSGASAGEVVVQASATLNSTTAQFTVQAWIKVDPAAGVERPILEWNGTSENPPGASPVGVSLWANKPAAGDLYVDFASTRSEVAPAQSVVQNELTATGVLTAGVWTMVTATSDGKDGYLYRNADRVGTKVFTTVYPFITKHAIHVGRRVSGTTKSFYGEIDQVRVLKSYRSAAEIEADYYSGIVKLSTPGALGVAATQYLGAQDYTPVASTGTNVFSTITITGLPVKYGQNSIYISLQDQAGNVAISVQSLTVTTAAPAAPALSAANITTTDVTWSWTRPSKVCDAGATAELFTCVDAAPYVAGLVYPGSRTETYGVNTLQARRARVVDAYGNGALTACTSAYTLANPPGAFTSANISSGSMTLGWSANGNPTAYTRYELGQWNGLPDGSFTTLISSPIRLSDDFKGTQAGYGGLSAATTYYWKLAAANGRAYDPLGNVFTAAVATAIPTLPTVPAGLAGSALGISSVAWSWGGVPTALAYTLADSAGTPSYNGGNQFSTTTAHTTNSAVTRKVRARNQSGAGDYGVLVTVYTQADKPTATALVSWTTATATLSWGAATNPAGTVYEVVRATDPGFTGLVAAYAASASPFSVSGLFPASTYYLRVRALNQDNVATGYDAAVKAVTNPDSAVSAATAPATPYAAPAGIVGLWHFDEGTSTRAADSSGSNNHGRLECLSAACTSTPTFITAGTLEGLGSAVRFTGQTGSLASVPHGASLNFGGSISVEAWARRTTSLMVSSSAVMAKGAFNDEAFALDFVSDSQGSVKARFLVRDNSGVTLYMVTSTQALAAGVWHHLAGVYDQPSFQLHVYVDGTLSSSAGGPASRRLNTHAVSIGSRESGTGSYDLSFVGDVDEAHVLNRVLLSTEVAASWRSGMPSGWSPPYPNDQVRLVIPANAFGGAATVHVSSDPAHNPVSANKQTVADALGYAPSSGTAGRRMTLIPGSIFEIVPQIGGVALTGNLASEVTVSIPYPDADNNTLVDGTFPPLPASNIRMFTLEGPISSSGAHWKQLSANSVDLAAKRVLAKTQHFSVFALFGTTGIQPDLDGLVVYPIPWKPGSGTQFDSAVKPRGTGLAFDHLPAEGSIRIFTMAGEVVAELQIRPADAGTVVWNGRNPAGRDAASGVYFAVVKSASQTMVRRFVLER